MATRAGSRRYGFLSEWAAASASGPPFALMNARTGGVVASVVEVAATSEDRRRGLLGRDHLDPATALVIAPCSAIHTFFMRFVIDVAFVDRDGHVLKVARGLRPWRIALSPRAYAVVEMHDGAFGREIVSAGDRFYLAR